MSSPKITLDVLSILADTAAASIELDNIKVNNLAVGIGIKDTSTDLLVVEQADNESVSYSNFSENVQVDFDWSNLISGYDCDEGCYEICVYDMSDLVVEHIQNGLFASDAIGWNNIFPVQIVYNAGVIFAEKSFAKLCKVLSVCMGWKS